MDPRMSQKLMIMRTRKWLMTWKTRQTNPKACARNILELTKRSWVEPKVRRKTSIHGASPLMFLRSFGAAGMSAAVPRIATARLDSCLADRIGDGDSPLGEAVAELFGDAATGARTEWQHPSSRRHHSGKRFMLTALSTCKTVRSTRELNQIPRSPYSIPKLVLQQECPCFE